MKKLLGSTLALAMFLPAGANAELLKNLKFGGQIDLQTTSARNITDFVTRQAPNGAGADNNDRIGHAHTRLMLNAAWDLLDDVHAKVSVVKGASNLAGGDRVYGSAAQDLNAWQTQTFIQEANVKIDKLLGALDTTVGRQFYGEPGDLVAYFGPRDNYGLTVDAIDMVRADWASESVTITGIAGKTADTAVDDANATAVQNVSLRGIVASLNVETVKPSVYLYNSVQHATGALGATTNNTSANELGKNSNLWVAGVKAKIAAAGLWAKVELAKNFGEDRSQRQHANFKGWAFLSKGGYKIDIPNALVVNPWLEFGIGSGDSNFTFAGNNNFQAINTDYRPGGIYGRFNNTAAVVLGQAVTGTGLQGGASNGLSNRIIWGLGVKATPAAWSSKLTAGLQYYRYAFHRVAPLASPNGGINNGIKPSRNIGSEVDLTGEWKHSENVSVNFTVGSFLPGAYIADLKQPAAFAASTGSALNPALMAAADLSIKF